MFGPRSNSGNCVSQAFRRKHCKEHAFPSRHLPRSSRGRSPTLSAPTARPLLKNWRLIAIAVSYTHLTLPTICSV
eukprot:14979544-Alexandrium_andersonii.AAC.1